MRYNVGVSVEGIYEITIDANTMEEAEDEALNIVGTMDFGELQCIDLNVFDISEE